MRQGGIARLWGQLAERDAFAKADQADDRREQVSARGGTAAVIDLRGEHVLTAGATSRRHIHRLDRRRVADRVRDRRLLADEARPRNWRR